MCELDGLSPASRSTLDSGPATVGSAPSSLLVRRWLLFLRERGLRAAIFRAWRRYGHGRDRFVVFSAGLAGPSLGPEPDGITFGAATAADLAGLSSLAPRHASRVRAFVEEGACWLHVARAGDRLVGYRLVTRDFRGHSMLAGLIRLQPDQVYTEYIFVHPEYRDRHVGRHLGRLQNQALAALGFREVVSAISAHNVASLRMNVRRGARPVFVVDSVRWLFTHRRRVSAVMPDEVRAVVSAVWGTER